MSKKFANRASWFVIVSLFMHIATYLGLGGLSRWQSFLTPKEKQIVEIEYLTPQQSRQLVEQDEKAVNDEVPDEARFMGRHNQRVVKETKAQLSGDYRNTGGLGPDTEQKQAQKAASEKPQSPLQQNKSDSGLPSLAALSPTMDISRQRDDNEVVEQSSQGLASSTNDYLKDVKPSIETMLNTREFVYYTYYQRIRSQLRQYWEPSIRAKVKKIFAQGRSIASTSDHITKVIIVLNADGNLIKVQVVENSGVYDLDEAAVEAFKAAEPFPNPPKGMMESDGTIKIRWDFILEA